jgi:glycosyltransferase involved in cell wall biosynthesis
VILFDTTNTSHWRHSSGLTRVSRRLREELGSAAKPVQWPWETAGATSADWILTPELFSEDERPGLVSLLGGRPCRLAAIYHDAIPIKHPSITWPKSVERHPAYMKLLARFDRVWAVSEASRRELLAFWSWQGVSAPPPVDVLPLGGDWEGQDRASAPAAAATDQPARIVSIGILEPRKNQGVLIEAGEALAREGVPFELHLVGRVNPERGRPVEALARAASRRWPGLVQHRFLGDRGLAELVRSARATAFPSIAEGCGLPVLESLWLGVPCLCGDAPAVLETARGGGCAVIEGNGLEGWKSALRKVLTDSAFRNRLAAEAAARTLPTWAGAAHILLKALV